MAQKCCRELLDANKVIAIIMWASLLLYTRGECSWLSGLDLAAGVCIERAQGHGPHHSQGGRDSQRCVWVMFCGPLTCCGRQSPAISCIRHHHGMGRREVVWSTTTSVLGVLCIQEVSLRPVAFLSSLLWAMGCCFDPWSLKAMLGWLCPGSLEESLPAGWQAQPVISSCMASSCSVAAHYTAWLCAVFGVQLRARSTPRQVVHKEP